MIGEMAVAKLRALAAENNVPVVSAHVLDLPRFAIWSGSSRPEQHHYGKGQLAIHTLEVVELCLHNYEYFLASGRKVCDRQKLFLAALFHDVGKTWDYQPKDAGYVDWESGAHKHLIHHISRSALVWSEAAHKNNIHEAYKDEVLHAILAHHQFREWGSPVQPLTEMAWILHLSDHMSAKMDKPSFKG